MSRVGLKPVEVPSGVEVKINNTTITVKGPKGELQREIHHDMIVKQEDNTITVARPSDHKEHRSLHGTTRSMINNMIEGVTKGFEKKLELVGVGYRAQKTGNKVVLNVGLSHPVEFVADNGLEIEVPSNTEIIVKGIDKERVGALASNIRSTRRPEPYKGKGVRYAGEYVRRKEGKTGK
jgi:large subunit ribosomal protein L6